MTSELLQTGDMVECPLYVLGAGQLACQRGVGLEGMSLPDSLGGRVLEVQTMPQVQAVDSIPSGSIPGDGGDGVDLRSRERGTDAGLPPLNRGDKNLNPPGIGFLALLREDLRTYDHDLTEPGFWAVALHRFGNWRMDIRPKVLRAPFTILFRFLARLAELIGGIHLPYTVRLGSAFGSGTTAGSCFMPGRLAMTYTFVRTRRSGSLPGIRSVLFRSSAIEWTLVVGRVFSCCDNRPRQFDRRQRRSGDRHPTELDGRWHPGPSDQAVDAR